MIRRGRRSDSRDRNDSRKKKRVASPVAITRSPSQVRARETALAGFMTAAPGLRRAFAGWRGETPPVRQCRHRETAARSGRRNHAWPAARRGQRCGPAQAVWGTPRAQETDGLSCSPRTGLVSFRVTSMKRPMFQSLCRWITDYMVGSPHKFLI